ncbi:MAG: hypothetical protein M0R17_00880 [Candidatus Omnitrophica bacterium]|jgi:hypothetical protein|nr:hypothetical protein [Candidatus Omnitrophota bacterium]
MSSKKNIPANKVAELLNEFNGKGPIDLFITTRTNPKVLKGHRIKSIGKLKVSLTECYTHPTNLTIEGVVKESTKLYSIGDDYEDRVNDTLAENGFVRNFESKPLPWGKWVDGSKILIEKDGVKYLRAYSSGNKSLAELAKEASEVVYFKVYSDGTEEAFEGDELKDLKIGFLPTERVVAPLSEGVSIEAAKPIVNAILISNISGWIVNEDTYNVRG